MFIDNVSLFVWIVHNLIFDVYSYVIAFSFVIAILFVIQVIVIFVVYPPAIAAGRSGCLQFKSGRVSWKNWWQWFFKVEIFVFHVSSKKHTIKISHFRYLRLSEKGKKYFPTWSHERSPPELRHCIVGKAIVDDQAKNRSVTTHLGWEKNINMKMKNFNGITKVVFLCYWTRQLYMTMTNGHWWPLTIPKLYRM